jgi:hypothetical protein
MTQEDTSMLMAHANTVFTHVAEAWVGSFRGTPEEQHDALEALSAIWDGWRSLAAIAAAPAWSWTGLVDHLIAEQWSPETTRRRVGLFQGVHDPQDDLENVVDPEDLVDAMLQKAQGVAS